MLKGTLDAVSPCDLLRFLAATRSTGCLEVRHGEDTSIAWLVNGVVTKASYTGTGPPATRDGEEALFDLVNTPWGEFEFRQGAAENGNLHIDAGDVARMLVGRRPARAPRTDRLPQEDDVVRMADSLPDDRDSVELSAQEWSMLARFDGRRSIGEVSRQLDTGRWEAAAIVYGLMASGLAHIEEVPKNATVGGARVDIPSVPQRAPDPVTVTPRQLAAVASPAPAASARRAPISDASLERISLIRELNEALKEDSSVIARTPSPNGKTRVSDDARVTRSLVSRLIQGIKRL